MALMMVPPTRSNASFIVCIVGSFEHTDRLVYFSSKKKNRRITSRPGHSDDTELDSHKPLR
jgi:hypothetical protein